MKNTLIVFIVFCSLQLTGQDINPDAYKSMRQSSLKSDINLYYNPLMDNYNIYFIKLDLEVSDQSTYISGNAIIQAKAVTVLDSFILDFSDYMIVDSIFINNKKVIAEHSNNTITYIFDTPLNLNDDLKAQIFYNGTPDPYGGGVGRGYDTEWQKYSTWTLSESFHAYEWWPCKQVLSDKIDSAYIFLTCDNDCMAGSNGLLDNVVDLPNDKKRFEWKTFYPINYYLISFAVAEYQDYSIYAKPEGVDSILIQNFVYNNPDYLSGNHEDIDQTIDFIELFSEIFGLYPFSKEKYGHCLTTIGGGMEHQTMTTLDNFEYTLVAHELAHMWFGDYVTCATWQDIWINEGFASYLEYIALEKLTSYNQAQNWMANAHSLALQEPSKSVYIPFEQAFNEGVIFNYRISYKKGASILHILRHQINNDELFFSSIRNYLSEYADSVATGEDFKSSLETSTGIDLEPFFNQWYFGKGHPKFDVEYTCTNDSLYLTINQSTASPETPLFQLFVDYKITYTGGDTTIRLYQSGNVETFKIPFNKTITKIEVDPENRILNQQGTVKQIETVGVFDSSFKRESLFRIYPNPVKDNLSVNFNIELSEKEKQIHILDINGRIIKSLNTSLSTLTIDLSDLSGGFYFIKGTYNSQSYSYKFIKQ